MPNDRPNPTQNTGEPQSLTLARAAHQVSETLSDLTDHFAALLAALDRPTSLSFDRAYWVGRCSEIASARKRLLDENVLLRAENRKLAGQIASLDAALIRARECLRIANKTAAYSYRETR